MTEAKVRVLHVITRLILGGAQENTLLTVSGQHRNPRYRPRTEPMSGMAGAKVAKVERIEWQIIPDPSTALAALTAGEVDMIESPLPDLLPALRRNRRVTVFPASERGSQYWMRFNHQVWPFNDVRVRRAADPPEAVSGS